MAPTIWPYASPGQQQALAVAPKLSCLLSMLGSCYIIFDVCRMKKRTTYHRLIFAMNIMDLLALCAWFATTWPMPAGTFGVAGAVGTQRTCDVQGFFSQLSISTVLYNACLVTYFMLVIRWGWTEQRIRATRLEYYVHFVCIGTGIGTAVASQLLGLYNPSGWQCWIASAPVGCTESWQLEPDQSAAEYPTSYACERGDNADLYLWFFFYIPLWSCIILATLALYQVYWAYRRQDDIAEKWRQKHLRLGPSSKKVITAGASLTHKIAALAKSMRKSKRKQRRRPPDHPTFTPSQIRYLQKQRSRGMNDVSGSSRYSNALGVNHSNLNSPEPSETTAAGPGYVSYARTASKSSPIMAGSKFNQNSTDAQNSFPTGGDQVNSGRTPHSRIAIITESARKTIDRLRGRTSAEDRASARKKTNPKTKMVTSQALLYLCSFYLAWFFQTILRIQESTSEEGIAYYHWVLLSAFFMPLQGLMNFIVYIRPKYLHVRRESRRLAAIAKQKKEEMKQRQASPPGSTLGTTRLGSSSALLTTSSMANSIRIPFDVNEHTLQLPSIKQELDESTTHSEPPDPDILADWTVAATENTIAGSDEANEYHEGPMSVGQRGKDEQVGHSDVNGAIDALFDNLTRPKSWELGRKLQRSNSSSHNFLSMRSPNTDIVGAHERAGLNTFHMSVSYDSQGHVLLEAQQIHVQQKALRLTQSNNGHSARRPKQQQAEPQRSQEQSRRVWRSLAASLTRRMRKSVNNESSTEFAPPNQNPPYTMEPGPFDPPSLTLPVPSGDESLYHTAGSGSASLHSSFQTAQTGHFWETLQSLADDPPSPRRKVSFAGVNNFVLRDSIAEVDINGNSDDGDDEAGRGDEAHPTSKRHTWALPRFHRLRDRSKHAHSTTSAALGAPRGITDHEVNSMRRNTAMPSSGDTGATCDDKSLVEAQQRVGGPNRLHVPEIFRDDSSSCNNSNAHILVQHKRLRKELMKKSKALKSTKKGAAKLVKGTVKGTVKQVKSIRNFASDFKDALKTAEVFDDWALLDGEELQMNDSNHGGGDEWNDRRDPASELVAKTGRRRRRFHSHGEEEKVEIDVIPEDPTESSRFADEFEKPGRSPYLPQP